VAKRTKIEPTRQPSLFELRAPQKIAMTIGAHPLLAMLRSPKILAIIGFAFGVLGRLCRDRVEALERKKTALENELDASRNSSLHQSTQLNQLAQETRMEVMHHQNSPNINYKTIIVFDTTRLANARSLVSLSADDVSRLIEKLIFGSTRFKQLLENVKPKTQTDDYQQFLQKSRENPDWTDAARVKLAIVSTVTAGLPIMVLGDKVITAAKRQVELLDSGVRVGRWIIKIFYLAGAALVLYGILKGIKIEASPE
jgi:hypothetical protein